MYIYLKRRAEKSSFSTFYKKRGVVLIRGLATALVIGTTLMALAMGLPDIPDTPDEGEDTTAVDIARNQLESVHSTNYLPPPSTYPPVVVPDHYNVTAEAVPVEGSDSNIEKVIVTVAKDGNVELVVETLRTNR